MKILITGGTVFVSRFVAEYFLERGDAVFVLNRGTRRQVNGCTVIKADRHYLNDALRDVFFDVILDITAYCAQDIKDMLDSGVKFRDYILLSSSAVYPETNTQPFFENQGLGKNQFWGDYGLNKIEAEKVALETIQNVYIVRPPYLYGQGNNVYREAFVFDCADLDRMFYLPRDGKMNLQFFYIRDLCRVFEAILQVHPLDRIFNVGNEKPISIRDWVSLCYTVAGKSIKFVEVSEDIPQRSYFCFYNYEYFLNVDRQKNLFESAKDANTFLSMTDLETGLQESYRWYSTHKNIVDKRNYIAYIDSELVYK